MSSAEGPSVAPACSRSNSSRTVSVGNDLNRTTRQRERIVGSCRSSDVPTRMITAPSGGSSSILRRQLEASVERWSASRMIAVRRAATSGWSVSLQQRPSRMRWAASPISDSSGIVARSSGFRTTSMSGCVPAAACAQDGQRPHGTSPGPVARQASACASRVAKRPLPMPAGPMKRNDPASRPRSATRASVAATSSCPSMPCQAMRLRTPAARATRTYHTAFPPAAWSPDGAGHPSANRLSTMVRMRSATTSGPSVASTTTIRPGSFRASARYPARTRLR